MLLRRIGQNQISHLLQQRRQKNDAAVVVGVQFDMVLVIQAGGGGEEFRIS